MRIAILADIRANEPALLAVLERIDRLQVDRIWVIGSLLSYGPDPVAVTDRLRLSTCADYCLVGHPDLSILASESLPEFNGTARRAFAWAHRSLRPRWWSGRSARARWAWLNSRPSQASDVGVQFFSGTPMHPEADFLPVAECPGRQERMEPHFVPVVNGAFVGTIGQPGIVFSDDMAWRRITDADEPVPTAGKRFIACPGSVGQPRDRDPRASFAVWDGQAIVWHRVAYDIGETRRRILVQSELDERNADRLEVGR